MPQTPEEYRANRLAIQKRYREKNRESLREKNRAYVALHRESRRELLAARAREAWRSRTPEQRQQRRLYEKAYRAANPRQYRQQLKKYREKYPEKIRSKARSYYESNAERIKQKTKEWQKDNTDKVTESRHKRRAQKFNAPRNDFTAQQWLAMQEAYQYRCAYCGKRCKGRLTQDHITPLSKGGSHTLSNIIPSCKPCNSKKRAGPVLKPVQPLLLAI